jgi:phosphatidylserine decarboxylase
MVRDGIYYALGFALAGVLVTAVLSSPLYALPFFILAAFCGWFFRDPERPLPAGPFALSPADGVVVAIVPPDSGTVDGRTRISIFLNIFDVHVNRAPISGVITDITYQKGRFLVASREEATAQNEQNLFTIRASDGTIVVFSQIAGLIARRIVCYKKIGDFVQAGERVGLIKFGSRVDVFLGPEWHIQVKPGMRVSAGTSVLAQRAGEVVLQELPVSAVVKEAAWQTS